MVFNEATTDTTKSLRINYFCVNMGFQVGLNVLYLLLTPRTWLSMYVISSKIAGGELVEFRTGLSFL